MHPALTTLGGLGLFLFGMAAMTSGLKKLAGDRLHTWLARATRTPFSGTLTGATVTAVIQSSSATTIAVVGFVGAGLLTFPQAVGVIFGANIGTTITGWIVALLGLKLKLTTAALPLMFVAAILYFMKSHRTLRGIGKALAGFALIFMGISFLQEGLAGAKDLIDLSAIDATGIGGRFVLMMLGILLTLITQSSSATVAASLTALHTGAIDLPQAVAAVIGADIGTTVKAMLASVGGNTGSKRTAFAHVAYNLFTGGGAFILQPAYLWVCYQFAPGLTAGSPEVIAVAYHSIFNIIGVSIAIPFAHPFARLIERLYPDREDVLVASLDERLLNEPRTAIRALHSATARTSAAALRATAHVLKDGSIPNRPDLHEIAHANESARDYSVRTGKSFDEEDIGTRELFAILHIIDHIDRIVARASKNERFKGMAAQEELKELALDVARMMEALAGEIEDADGAGAVDALEASAAAQEEDKARFRQKRIAESSRGELTADALEQALDGSRWLRRLTYHAARIGHYWRDLSQPG